MPPTVTSLMEGDILSYSCQLAFAEVQPSPSEADKSFLLRREEARPHLALMQLESLEGLQVLQGYEHTVFSPPTPSEPQSIAR